MLPRTALASGLLLAAFAACGQSTSPAPPATSSSSGSGTSSSSGSSSGSASGSSSGSSGSPDASSSGPTTLASNLPFVPGAMVSDGVDLFIVSVSAGDALGSVWKLPVSGGTPTAIASGAWAPPEEEFLAVDAANVYFLQAGTLSTTYGPTGVTFASVPKTGGPVSTHFSSPDLCSATAVNGTLYWTEYDVGDAGGEGGAAEPTVTVKAAPFDAGAPPTTLGTTAVSPPAPGYNPSIPTSVAVVGSSVFLAGLGFQAASLGADGGWTPLADWPNDYAPGGSAMTVVAAGADGAYAFGYAEAETPLVLWLPDGTSATIATPPSKSVMASTVFDGANVYWSSADGVHVAAPDGSGAAFVYPYEALFEPIAVDDAAVYWAVSPADTTLEDGGAVWMIQRTAKAL